MISLLRPFTDLDLPLIVGLISHAPQEQPEPERPQRSWLIEGIILALIPASAYLWALYYEVGFRKYFHIPYGLISLNPTTVLASSLPAFFMVSLPVMLVLFVVFFAMNTPDTRYRPIIAMIIIILSMRPILLYSGREPLIRVVTAVCWCPKVIIGILTN
jgi:hypothetical protein